MKNFLKKGAPVLLAALLAGAVCAACGNETEPVEDGGTDFSPAVTMKTISKDEYRNKTLGGLLGQFAGFLSGIEFKWNSGVPYVGMPESFFEFLNGPYAGNYEHFVPPDPDRYDRLRINPDTGRNEVWSDDDYHIDIFNQLILDERGYTAYDVKETWKKYPVGDWGGGADAARLIATSEMLAPFTGSIEGGNRYGWCTEAYIENETLGMNAPGMPNTATKLVDTFATNVGYFESVWWAKFYAAMYSLAYFERDVRVVMDKAKVYLPEGSWPRRMYDRAFELYEENPDDYAKAAQTLADERHPLYRIDNVQTDPNVNGGFAILAFLYGRNSYLDTCKYASILGFDGDCTAAITQGVMGILRGFKPGNEEYEAINDTLYYDGEGVYFNDTTNLGYVAKILSKDYPERQKIDDIVDLYRKNFEKILVENGGEVKEDCYIIPTSAPTVGKTFLFENYGAENRNSQNFTAKNGSLSPIVENGGDNVHSGYAAFSLTGGSGAEVYHTYDGLVKGRTYRLSVYVKTSAGAQVSLFARSGAGSAAEEITFANATSIIGKELIFRATDEKMQVGFSFPSSASANDNLIFDDFMLEEIEREELSSVSQDLKLSSDKLLKTISKPAGVKAGEEVILSIRYRNYSGSPAVVSVQRNGKVYGGAVLSNTSKNSMSGYAYLELPYVFEKDSDAVQLVFDGKMYFGDIAIYRGTQYLFR